MPKKYIPFYKDAIKGQALLDNFVRTRRILKYEGNNEVYSNIQRGMPYYDVIEKECVGNDEKNLVIRGDCVSACAYLKEKGTKVDLVYIDPPFASGADYAKKVYIRRNPKLAEKIKKAEEEMQDDEIKVFEEKMYGDVWNKEAYLNWMYENLCAIKSIMSDTASIYVHLDYHIVHYVKILMDEVFGEDNLVNEIIWRRKLSAAWAGNQLGITTDTILWYANNGDEFIYNPEYTLEDENTQNYLKERFVYDDNDGRGKYMKSPLVNSLYRPNLKYVFHGVNPPVNGWLYKQERLEEWYKKNELVMPDDPNMRIYRKIYASSYQGQPIQNIWLDIPIANPMSKERIETDYATMKPEALLKRIIELSSNKGMLVADFFGGSGVTAKVANDLDRNFIHVDIGLNSIQIARDRLYSNNAKFKVLEINDGVNLYRNPVQTMDKIKKLIPGLKNEDSLDKFWEGSISDTKNGMMPVYVPNLMDSTTRILDLRLINRIIHEALPDIENKTVSKVIIYYIDITDIKEIENYINDNNDTGIDIELRDLKPILDNTTIDDEVMYSITKNDNNYETIINTFVSDRLNQKINKYNDNMKANKKDSKFIQISDEGLELIEYLSLDCTNSEGSWNSDSEIKIDKLGYVSINGERKKEFWNGKIISNKKPLRLKIRNIAGDETIVKIEE